MKDYADIIWSVVGTIVFMVFVLVAGYYVGWSSSQRNFCEQNLGGTYSSGSCYESDSKIDF